jgi:hypothetical protein
MVFCEREMEKCLQIVMVRKSERYKRIFKNKSLQMFFEIE